METSRVGAGPLLPGVLGTGGAARSLTRGHPSFARWDLATQAYTPEHTHTTVRHSSPRTNVGPELTLGTCQPLGPEGHGPPARCWPWPSQHCLCQPLPTCLDPPSRPAAPSLTTGTRGRGLRVAVSVCAREPRTGQAASPGRELQLGRAPGATRQVGDSAPHPQVQDPEDIFSYPGSGPLPC